MLAKRTLEQLVERIVAVAHPSRIILFGSYGRGNATEDSDVDIMVIKSQVDNQYEELLSLYQAVGTIGAGVDLLLYSEAELGRRSQVPGTVLYWAQQEGMSLYEAAH